MRLAVPVLVRMLRTCVATVLRLMQRASAISRLLFPAAIKRSTSTSRAFELLLALSEGLSLSRAFERSSARCPGDRAPTVLQAERWFHDFGSRGFIASVAMS